MIYQHGLRNIKKHNYNNKVFILKKSHLSNLLSIEIEGDLEIWSECWSG